MFSCLSWAQNTEELLSVCFRQLWACPHHMDRAPPSEGPELAHNGQTVPLGGLSLYLWPRVESPCHAGAASWRALPLRLLPASRMGVGHAPQSAGGGQGWAQGPFIYPEPETAALRGREGKILWVGVTGKS